MEPLRALPVPHTPVSPTGSRTGRRARAVVVAVGVTAALVTVAVAGAAAARPGPARATAVRPTPAPATKPAAKAPAKVPTTTPPRITTLGALNRWMGAAVTARATASFTRTTVVGARTVTDRRSGVVRWASGTASFAYTDVNQPYVGVTKAIVLPGEAYTWGEKEARDEAGKPVWVRLREGADPFWTLEFQLLRQQLNPALMYPGLPALAVRRATSPVTVGGTRCWVYTVRMTTEQNFRSQPVAARPDPSAQAGGVTTVTFTVDAQGLPHKVVVLNAWPKSRYSEVTTFSGWGRPVTIQPPSGTVVDSADH